jgi:hypothetical protein
MLKQEEKICGMSEVEIRAAVEDICARVDTNHPVMSGTQENFFKVLQMGTESLVKGGSLQYFAIS